MIRINDNYTKLSSSYLFSNIAKRVAEFKRLNPEKKVISFGIGDVTRALPHACITAFHRAVDEMADDATFRGYGPEQGYDFLREAIAKNDYQALGADIAADEIFISDGAKCDTGNIQELFSRDIKIAVPDPVYPVYVDTNVMAGRTGAYKNGRYEGLVYLESTEGNNYVPDIPGERVDLIYLCFPNNPTGACITADRLRKWVEYAADAQALILFDAAYEAYIREPSLPRSIYQIGGAREVAIEFRSYSKTAGFTGTRCAFSVIPKTCLAYDSHGDKHQLHTLWNRRHTTKFNGVSYPVQRAAEAVYSAEGRHQVREMTDYYLENARLIRAKLISCGLQCSGGENAPYVWVKTNVDSWDFFDLLLNKAAAVCTPGSGFGACGKGYIRFSAFNRREQVLEGLERISGVLAK